MHQIVQPSDRVVVRPTERFQSTEPRIELVRCQEKRRVFVERLRVSWSKLRFKDEVSIARDQIPAGVFRINDGSAKRLKISTDFFHGATRQKKFAIFPVRAIETTGDWYRVVTICTRFLDESKTARFVMPGRQSCTQQNHLGTTNACVFHSQVLYHENTIEAYRYWIYMYLKNNGWKISSKKRENV